MMDPGPALTGSERCGEDGPVGMNLLGVVLRSRVVCLPALAATALTITLRTHLTESPA